MKFGKNLAHLSIPEWKVYNLDYNDLKATIREVTQSNSSDLSHLFQKFVENFDYLNLFILTKSGELARKLKVALNEFSILRSSDEDTPSKFAKLSNLHYKVINDISIELRKLTKFVLVQKIAVKKIFKKFSKHYPDKTMSKRFISTVTHLLQTTPKSFFNFDLTALTADLLMLLGTIDCELKSLHEALHKKFLYNLLQRGKLRKTHSVSTMKTVYSSLSRVSSQSETLNVNVGIDQAGRFDLITMFKKNFSLSTLIPKDIITRNDVSLSMDVYLNIPKIKESCRVSVTYLTTGIDDVNPSYIMSYADEPDSLIVVYTGGLRKYSYCCLPNSVTEALLVFLQTDDDQLKHQMLEQLLKYVESKGLSNMTKVTINSVVCSDAKPALKLVCDRTRYFLNKDASQHDDNQDIEQIDSISPLDTGAHSAAATMTVDTKIYGDSYYMVFDENISTTNNIGNSISFDSEGMDPFPFNQCSIHLNDINLHNFDASLSSTLTDNILENKYKPITLKKMPVKIQNFVKNSSVHLYKNLSLFDYMRSCYFNVIPDETNNHYLKLLNLNLFKNYEIVEIVNNQTTVDDTIIQDRARHILNRQKSCQSFSMSISPDRISNAEASSQWPQSDHKDFKQCSDTAPLDSRPYDQVDVGFFRRVNELDNFEDDEDEEDSYFIYLSFNNDLKDNMLNNFILSFIKFKHRMRRALGAFNFVRYGSYRWKHREKELLDREPITYDSINEDPTFFNTANDYQIQLIYDYDNILSFIYFTLCCTSIFISGINLGIVYGILKLQEEDIVFNIFSNLLVFMLLVFGYLFSLIFSMTSINLNFQRFGESPASHTGIIWAGFIMVTVSVIWTVLIFVP